MRLPDEPLSRTKGAPLAKCYPKCRTFQGKSFKLKKLRSCGQPTAPIAIRPVRLRQLAAGSGVAGRDAGAEKHRVAGQDEEAGAHGGPLADILGLCAEDAGGLAVRQRGADDRPDRLAEPVGARRSHGVDRDREVAGTDEHHVDAVGRGDLRRHSQALRPSRPGPRRRSPRWRRRDIRGCGSRSRRPGRARRRARPAADSASPSPRLAPARRSRRAGRGRRARRCRARRRSPPAHGPGTRTMAGTR